MNNKVIKKLEEKIKMTKEYSEYLEIKHKECYDKFGYDGQNIVPDNYEAKHKVEDFEYVKSVLEILNTKGIDISKKYFIMSNVYLSVFEWNDSLSFYFYVKDDSWLYDNFISSHSGINEWVFKAIDDAYNLYSGNSEYNYAFGTLSLSGYKNRIENQRKDGKFYNDRPYKPEEVANAIESLINFFTDKKNETRNAIIKDLNFKFSMMKKLIKEED